MSDQPKLLVVDDEEAICEGCRRIFSRQGFDVMGSNDARRGLDLASEQDYDAILLDIKMPSMDGIEFLEQLRHRKRQVPVILMTGFPSIPNAISAVRLGASGYVTKPFTPEEITAAVRKLFDAHPPAVDAAKACDAWQSAGAEVLFWDEAWIERGTANTARTGTLANGAVAGKLRAVRLPRIGEVVYQGLPLAALTLADDTEVIVPAPATGIVESINESLARQPELLLDDPCGRGWIAEIRPTRWDAEARNCTVRRMLLVSADPRNGDTMRRRLANLGAAVRWVPHLQGTIEDWHRLAPLLAENDCNVMLFDADSYGEAGPQLVAQINAAAPSMRVIVAASPDGPWETAYRSQRIFYFAVEPLEDGEMVEVLDSAFRLPWQTIIRDEPARSVSDAVSTICITNRHGSKVCLIAAPGLLKRGSGLGARIRKKLFDRLFPIQTMPGEANVTPVEILKAATAADRVLVLLARDTGRIAGSLFRDTQSEFVSVSGEGAGKVTALVVQPANTEGQPLDFSPKTLEMLATHIVEDMAAN